MTKTHWAAVAAASALMLGALACATPDVTSGPETAQAAQLTVIAGLTQANFQLTPDDSQATQYAGFLQTSIAQQVLLTKGAQGGAIGTAVAQTIAAGSAPTQPPPTITLSAATPGAAQLTAAPAQPTPAPAQPTAAPATLNPSAGAVSGKVCYAATIIPALTVYARDLGSGAIFKQDEPLDTHQYTLGNLPGGQYYLFAYTQAGPGHPSAGLAYTQFVECGLLAACTDHSMIAVEVDAGQTTPGIDLCDGQAAGLPAQPQ